MLANMAEVAVRALEAAWAQQHSHVRGLRAPAAFSAATMLVDASQRAWRVLHLNAAVSAMTGGAVFEHICCTWPGSGVTASGNPKLCECAHLHPEGDICQASSRDLA